MRTNQKGFTLIEILIVVAIIAILASVVLVGLGPTQQKGRDARRLSDLREVQNALELYYNQNGQYPTVSGTGSAAWSALSSAITSANIGITQPLPNDPSAGATYYYSPEGTNNSGYVLGACLEGQDPTGYVAPQYAAPTGMTCAGGASSTYLISM